MENSVKFKDRNVLYRSVLKELNLQKIEDVYSRRDMGNYFITFSAEKFLIQYVNDRNQLSIFVASNSAPARWVYLSSIEKLINKTAEIIPGDSMDLNSILRQNDFLRGNFDKIAELLNNDNFQNTIDQIEASAKANYKRKHPDR